jgi:hypothetical protein
MTRLLLASTLLAAVAVAASCGGSGHHAAAPATTPAATTAAAPPAPTTTSASGPGALQGEANAAATGDIPDNQVFLTFRNGAAGYSIKYPEGWAQRGTGGLVTFRDKNNIVRIVVDRGRTPTRVGVQADLHGTHLQGPPHQLTLAGKPAFKVVYTTQSAPNAVTGKRVTLVVDRYYLWNAGRRAVVDLGTAVGVDNVDAYRLMIESFRWS